MTNEPRFEFDVFISYRTAIEPDRSIAKLLQQILENYPVPRSTKDVVVLPKRWRTRLRVCRDTTDMLASGNLNNEIQNKLRRSRYLILVGTKQVAQSEYCRAEVRQFREIHGETKVLPLLCEGEMETSIRPLMGSVVPLAADIRASDRKGILKKLQGDDVPRVEQVKFKLLAPILGCSSPNELVKRHQAHLRKTLLIYSCIALIISLAFAFVTMGLVDTYQSYNNETTARHLANDFIDPWPEENSVILAAC